MKLLMKKWFFVLATALLVGLSFPTLLFGYKFPNLGFLGWFGLVPLFYATRDAKPWEVFRYGWISAALYFLFSSYWLYTTLHDYGFIAPIFSVSTLFLLAAAMGIYAGAALGLARWLNKKWGTNGLVIIPALWTLFEWARNYTPFGGFPWANLAVSQSEYLPFIQIADITGVYGVIFILVWFNVWLTEAVLVWRKKNVPGFKVNTVCTLLLLGLVLGYGFYRLPQESGQLQQAPRIRVGLIQPNIPQEEKFSEAFQKKHIDRFMKAVATLQNNTDLIVWPETSWHDTLWVEQNKIPPNTIGITNPKNNFPYTLLGLSFLTQHQGEQKFFNSAALLNAHGEILGKHHKTHLIPFGEYVPMSSLLSFIEPVAALDDFERGTFLEPLSLEVWKLAPLICGEDIFPEIARRQTINGAHLFVNLTNNAWFGRSSQPYHHLAMAVFRSIENRRTTVRATNTGISAVIEPTGKIVSQAPIFMESLLIYQAPLNAYKTLYTRLGDWFILFCFLLIPWQILRARMSLRSAGRLAEKQSK